MQQRKAPIKILFVITSSGVGGAEKVLYMSATPFTDIGEMHYLKRLNLWDRERDKIVADRMVAVSQGYRVKPLSPSELDEMAFVDWAVKSGSFLPKGAKKKIDNLKPAMSEMPRAAIAAALHTEGKSILRTTSMEGVHSFFHTIQTADLSEKDRKSMVLCEQLIQKAKEIKADVIGLSAVLTTTMPKMKELVDTLVEEGIRDRFKVIIGGAPVTQEFADYIGADGYGPDAARGVELVRTVAKRSS